MANFNPVQRLRIYERDGWQCQYCGTRLYKREEATLDHRIPKSLGGTKEDSNLFTSCRPCNIIKADSSERRLRLMLAFSTTPYSKVITLEQYHALRHLGVKLEPLPELLFHYET